MLKKFYRSIGSFCFLVVFLNSILAQDNPNIPPSSGVLFPLAVPIEKSNLKVKGCIAHVMDEKTGEVLAQFSAGKKAPAVGFPCPVGGWNLSKYRGIEVELVNSTDVDLVACLRADNPGDKIEELYNIERIEIGPRATQKIQLPFGMNYGSVGYPLDSTKVSTIYVIVEKPKQDVTLYVKNLKAYGSSADRAPFQPLSSPADRTPQVQIPEWIGKRPPVEGSWVKTLDEDFNEPILNPKIWTPRLTWDGPNKSQLQRYSQENVLIEDGILKIKCEKKSGNQYDNPSLETRDYTAGTITSFGKWTQLYGYIEARIKLPGASGLWPVFGMMPDRGGLLDPESIKKREDTYKGGMEIHIMEHQTEWGSGRYHARTHWDGYKSDHKKWSNMHVYYGRTPGEWHVWGVLWEPGKLTWYCDGIKKEEWKNDRIASVPESLYFAVQIGEWASKLLTDYQLPDYLQVDYVRAWQLQSRVK